jgi:hypothetical protein
MLVLAGCGSSSSAGPDGGQDGAASGLVNPCTLLTSVQVRQLAVKQGQRQPDGDALGGASCSWSTFGTGQSAYIARLLDKPVPGSTSAVSVAGLPTSQVSPANANMRTDCVYLIELGSGVNLWAEYNNTSGNQPGITHSVACSKAQAGAAAMISSYHALRH